MGLPPRSTNEKSLTFLEHLDELRHRLIVSLVAVFIGAIAGYVMADRVNMMLIEPYERAGFGARPVTTAQPVRISVAPDGSLQLLEGPFQLTPPEEVEPEEPAPAETESKFSVPPEARILLPGGTPRPEYAKLSSVEFVSAEGGEVLGVLDAGRRVSGLTYLKPMDPFLIRLKTAAILGIIFALPVLVYQVFAFVSPGLYPHEKKVLAPFFVLAAFLFPMGVAFAYLMLGPVFLLLGRYGLLQVEFIHDVRAYLSFTLTTLLVFGAVFELPVVSLILTRMGVVSVETLRAHRKHVFCGILLLAAIITPPDPFTMLAMGIPLFALFEMSLVLSRFVGRALPERVTDDTGEQNQA